MSWQGQILRVNLNKTKVMCSGLGLDVLVVAQIPSSATGIAWVTCCVQVVTAIVLRMC